MTKKTILWILIPVFGVAMLICCLLLLAESSGISQVFGNRVGTLYSYWVRNTSGKFTSQVIIDGVGVYNVQSPTGWSYSTTAIPGKVVWTATSAADPDYRIPSDGQFHGGFSYEASEEAPFGYFTTKGEEVPPEDPSQVLGEGSVVTGIPVELTAFEASESSGWVVLTWITQSETENLGFHVYRSQHELGGYSQINPRLIPGAGSSDSQHRYSFVDKNVESDETYYYRLADVDFDGHITLHGPISIAVSVLPTGYTLGQNYPNPFNAQTIINFSLAEPGNVSLIIDNMNGQLVRTLIDEFRETGAHAVIWNGRDDSGQTVASGTYVYKMEVNTYSDVKRMNFMK